MDCVSGTPHLKLDSVCKRLKCQPTSTVIQETSCSWLSLNLIVSPAHWSGGVVLRNDWRPFPAPGSHQGQDGFGGAEGPGEQQDRSPLVPQASSAPHTLGLRGQHPSSATGLGLFARALGEPVPTPPPGTTVCGSARGCRLLSDHGFFLSPSGELAPLCFSEMLLPFP